MNAEATNQGNASSTSNTRSTRPLPMMPTMSNSQPWFVLVGGDGCRVQGANVSAREQVHTSLGFVGEAHEELRSSGVPRSNTITIVQLADYLRTPHVYVPCIAPFPLACFWSSKPRQHSLVSDNPFVSPPVDAGFCYVVSMRLGVTHMLCFQSLYFWILMNEFQKLYLFNRCIDHFLSECLLERLTGAGFLRYIGHTTQHQHG